MMLKRGMGEYPGYYCYDSARPSWLPYWFDSVAESKCKWSPSTVAGNIAACASNSPTCQNPSTSQQNPDLSGPGVAPAGTPSNTPGCGTFQSFDFNSGQCVFDPATPSFMMIAGIAGLILFVIARAR